MSDDLLADSHNILKGWKNYFSQLLNVHGINDGRQTEMYTAEPTTYPVLSRLTSILKT
jgi:hypothetical protein